MSEMKPAMTPEEWVGVRDGLVTGGVEVSWDETYVRTEYDSATGRNRVVQSGVDSRVMNLSPRAEPHALAALCLYGQPFGFTREDVELVRRSVTGDEGDWTGWDSEAVLDIAARIEALLPPEK